MARIPVIVAAAQSDLLLPGIVAAAAAHPGMTLVGDRHVELDEVDTQLAALPPGQSCALVLVGEQPRIEQLARRLQTERPRLVVLRIDVIDHLTRMAHYSSYECSLKLSSMLAALHDLASGSSADPGGGFAVYPASAQAGQGAPARPLLAAAIAWIHAVLRHGACSQPAGHGDIPGLTLSAASVADLLDDGILHGTPGSTQDLDEAEHGLEHALADADARTEPLAATAATCRLSRLELRTLLLAMAPELDLRYQRCIGLLLDDLGRRTGTLGLFATLLGKGPEVRCALAESGNLARWRLFEQQGAGLPGADQSLRIDPPLMAWLAGDDAGLDGDPAIVRACRSTAWPGASLCTAAEDRQLACARMRQLLAVPCTADPASFVLFSGERAAWCALLEAGAGQLGVRPIRVDAVRVAALDPAAIEDSALRLCRLARLAGRPLLLDTGAADLAPEADDGLRLMLAVLAHGGVRSAILCAEPARIIRLLSPAPFALVEAGAIRPGARLANVRAAARALDLDADDEVLANLARQYPLEVDGFEQALRLAQARAAADGTAAGLPLLLGALQYVAAEGVSRMAENIEPPSGMGDVILPADRVGQLDEIVASMRLAGTVLDGWRFGEQLPYGRGVTALFHGPSGTGKTMAALSVAARLQARVLRIDLSRVVSKYIGETEKNIDRIFLDAHRSGAAILIDEAEALLGKRSEVKDAHDRYANIEVAYLLQRMETYDGLAILTTNLRQNLDPAFLRRLRFVIEFPRPDAEARERIWRRCLPERTHTLSDAALRLLARKIDLTGGHIRQITLRAAYLAAAKGELIALPHVAQATAAELNKLGMAGVELTLPANLAAA